MDMKIKRLMVASTSAGGRIPDLRRKIQRAKTNKKISLKGINPAILAALLRRRKKGKPTGVVSVNFKPVGKKAVRRVA